MRQGDANCIAEESLREMQMTFLKADSRIFTCGEARRSMDDNYSPPYKILEIMAFRDHKDMET